MASAISVRHLAAGGLVAAAALSVGCSVIGAVVGSSRQQARTRKVAHTPLQGWEVHTVKPGTALTVTLASGEQIAGRYDGLETMLPSEYGPRYAGARATVSDLSLPAIGDRIVVVPLSGSPVPGLFHGFSAGHVLLRADGGPEVRAFQLRQLTAVTAGDGTAMPPLRLDELIAGGRVPLVSRMIVGARRVPLDEVRRVQLSPARHGGRNGFLVGLALDAIVIAVVADATEKPRPEPIPSVTSCPYFYSFDGERYTLDAEPFGQALFEAVQRPDWVRMDHLREVDGTYRIRMANELDEIEHVDEVKLLVADSAAGQRLVPDADGRLHVLVAPQAPRRAATLAGLDVSSAIRARDERAWTSDPFTRPAGTRAGRDGLVLEFPRPAGATAVTLAFTVKSTPWASHLLPSLMALHGRELPAWQQRMNADAAARREFLSALRREGPLTLRIWDGQSWQERGVLANMGPMVWKEQAVRLDLEGIPQGVLRVSLDATAGMWIVDSVAADFASHEATAVAELSAARATDGKGNDLRGTLAAADARRFVLRKGDSAELVFRSSPRRPGERPVVILKATGFYSILVPAEDQPDPALFQRIVREPGEFARFAHGRLRADLARAVADARD